MRQGKILIVEDELIARENLDHVLKKEGYDTVAVESGVLAFKELEKQEFDLVMTDLKMQQVDGLQVLERTKEALSRHRSHYDYRVCHGVHRGGGHAERRLSLPAQTLQD